MNNINNLDNNIEFLDVLTIINFVIGLKNYGETLNQTDKQDLMKEVDQRTSKILKEIQEHLKIQDEKIDKVLKRLDKRE